MSRRHRRFPFTFKTLAHLLTAGLLVTIIGGIWNQLPPRTVFANNTAQPLPFSRARANPGVIAKATNHSDDLRSGPLFSNPTSTVFINEFLYDITGTDAGEFIEVAAPAGTNMGNYSIVLYNGSGGAIYDTDALSGTTTDQGGGYGTVSISYPSNGIQNGSPDGIALINTSTNTLVQFLCYEGTFVGVGGLANGVTCTDIGVSQSGTNAAGTSLQLQGSGTTYGDFTWNATSIANTQNAPNTGQTFTGGPPVLTLNIGDVTMGEGNAGTTAFIFNVSLTGGTAPAGGVTFNASSADGTTNPANAPGDYTALVNQPGSISSGNSSTTVTVLVNGDITPEANETFFVNISSVVGATAGDAQGLGTINNDDVTLTPIHTIQGSGTASPMAGSSVTTSGIVTGIKQGSSGGFFIQEPDATIDADQNTSEGIFVFTGSSVPAGVVIGNSVQVGGTVQEFIPSADLNQNPGTELSGAITVNVLSTGNSLPAAVVITAAETTDPSETTDSLDTLEEYEGMRVQVNSLTVCGPTQGSITESSATVNSTGVFFGVVTGVARPFREPGIAISDPVPAPNPANVPRFDENPARIRVDSDAQPTTTPLDVTAGTVITNLVGELEYSFRAYTILPEAASPPTVGAQPGSVPVPTPTADELTVASFNMERFFDTVNDPATSDPVLTMAAFDRRVAKASLIIRTVERYPDVIGVQEVENLTTLQAVATQINNDAVTIDLLPNPNYTAYLVEGNDIGGIDVGFLVKQSRVTQYSVTQLELAGCDHVTPSTCNNYVDPNTGGLDILNDRPPLVLIASIPRTGGGLLGFTVIVNHLRSLSGVDDTTVAGTGTVGARVREKRRKQAEFLANYVQGRQTANSNEKIITVGDINAFRVNDGFVDSIGTILGAPAPADQVVLPSVDLVSPDQTDLVDTLAALQQYSYNFDGNAQTLDHIIVNPPALAILSRFAYARNDSDFAVKNYESTNELRISDHDQPVAYFSLHAPTAADATVTGQVVDRNGVPVEGAAVRMSGTQNRLTITDAQGNYHFNNVETNGFYTLVPARANFTFSPAQRTFSQLGQNTEATFTANSADGALNPLDTTEYFVRQQYLDFLRREPDEAGFTAWVNGLNNCATGDTSCDRVHVSEMFFRSEEFQQRGYFIYRFYSTALGRKPDFAEFAPDMASVSGFLTNDQLEAAKTAFANDFVRRPAFAQYATMTNAQYVDALARMAGVTLGNRQALIDSLDAGMLTRAQALRQIAESGEVYARYYNQAFVVMEYFGYLKRDPDALYLNWIDVLNQGGDSRQMVEGFVNSTEYRNRFAR